MFVPLRDFVADLGGGETFGLSLEIRLNSGEPLAVLGKEAFQFLDFSIQFVAALGLRWHWSPNGRGPNMAK
jgi:hypothetical protein